MAVTFIQPGSPTRSNACDPKLPARLDTPTKSTPAHVSNERWPMEPPIDYVIGRSGGISQACQRLGLSLVDVSSGRFATAAPQAERIIPGLGAQQDKQAAVWQWLTKTNPLPLQGGVEIPAPDYDSGAETPLTAPSGRLDSVVIPPPDYDCSSNSGLQGAHRDPPPDYKMVRIVGTTGDVVLDDTLSVLGTRISSEKTTLDELVEQFMAEGPDAHYSPAEKRAFWEAAVQIDRSQYKALAAILKVASLDQFDNRQGPLPSMTELARVLSEE